MARYRAKRGILFYVFVLMITAILAIGVLFAYTFTDKFSRPFQLFYVEHNNERILYEKNLVFELDKEYRFNCKDTFLFLNSKDNQCKGYLLNIYPNPDVKPFNFTVDGFSRSYLSIGDISPVFEIDRHDTYFTIKPTLTMQEILNALHSDKEVVLPQIDFTKDFYFLLAIGNIDSSSAVYIQFKVI